MMDSTEIPAINLHNWPNKELAEKYGTDFKKIISTIMEEKGGCVEMYVYDSGVREALIRLKPIAINLDEIYERVKPLLPSVLANMVCEYLDDPVIEVWSELCFNKYKFVGSIFYSDTPETLLTRLFEAKPDFSPLISHDEMAMLGAYMMMYGTYPEWKTESEKIAQWHHTYDKN